MIVRLRIWSPELEIWQTRRKTQPLGPALSVLRVWRPWDFGRSEFPTFCFWTYPKGLEKVNRQTFIFLCFPNPKPRDQLPHVLPICLPCPDSPCTVLWAKIKPSFLRLLLLGILTRRKKKQPMGIVHDLLSNEDLQEEKRQCGSDLPKQGPA